jgi:hypothetical protein
MKLAFLAVFLALPVYAQEPRLPATDASIPGATLSTPGNIPADMNGGDATMSLTVAAMAVITGQTPTEVKPTVFVDVDSPAPFGKKSVGRIFARLGIGISPGNSVPDPTGAPSLATLGNPANFQSVEGGIGFARVVGVTADGIIKTAILAEVGFRTRNGNDPTAIDNTSHYWGAGFRLSHANGSQVTILGGQDGQLGQAAAMQVMVYGSLVVPKTAGIAMLIGDASFSFFAPVSVTLPLAPIPPGSSVTVPQAGALRSNIVQLGVAIDAAQAFAQLTNRSKP